MKILRSILLVLLGIIVAIGIVGLFLPRTSHVERSISIAAPADAIYAKLSDLRQFNDWSPWADLDPNTEYEYAGTGIGSSVSWSSEDPSVGSGTMTITGLTPNERVDMELEFGEPVPSSSYFALAPDGENTQVTWAFDTTFGFNPYYRYFGLMLDTMVGNSYEKGLGDLKRLMESG